MSKYIIIENGADFNRMLQQIKIYSENFVEKTNQIKEKFNLQSIQIEKALLKFQQCNLSQKTNTDKLNLIIKVLILKKQKFMLIHLTILAK